MRPRDSHGIHGNVTRLANLGYKHVFDADEAGTPPTPNILKQGSERIYGYN